MGFYIHDPTFIFLSLTAILNFPFDLKDIAIHPYLRYKKQILQGRERKNKGHPGSDSNFAFFNSKKIVIEQSKRVFQLQLKNDSL